jgi:hypothetical protein
LRVTACHAFNASQLFTFGLLLQHNPHRSVII